MRNSRIAIVLAALLSLPLSAAAAQNGAPSPRLQIVPLIAMSKPTDVLKWGGGYNSWSVRLELPVTAHLSPWLMAGQYTTERYVCETDACEIEPGAPQLLVGMDYRITQARLGPVTPYAGAGIGGHFYRETDALAVLLLHAGVDVPLIRHVGLRVEGQSTHGKPNTRNLAAGVRFSF